MRKKILKRHYKTKFLIFLCLIAALFLGGCATRKAQTVRIEQEANQIMDVLNENGIKAKKNEIGEGERKTFEIWIDGDDEDLAAAIQLMEDHCLGQPEPPPVEGGTVITSIEVERAREQRRLKMNIESQLRKLPGVTCVNVNFVPPQDRSLAINPYPSTASVLVNYKTQNFPVSKEDIAGLVARSVPALQPENVSVVLTAKPLRAMPNNQAGYKFTRVVLVAGIGFAVVSAFVSIVFFLQNRRREQTALAESESEDFQTGERQSLLDEGYGFDEDEDDNESNLR